MVVFFALCVHSLAASLLQAPGAAASVGFGGYVGSSRVDTASPFEGEVSLVRYKHIFFPFVSLPSYFCRSDCNQIASHFYVCASDCLSTPTFAHQNQ